MKVLVRLGILLAAVWVVVATPVWGIVYTVVLALLVPGITVGEAAHHPSCRWADRVQHTFRPLVSDEALVRYWAAHRSEMTQAADDFARRLQAREFPAGPPASTALALRWATGPEWSEQPYSAEAAAAVVQCLAAARPQDDPATRSAIVLACTRGQIPAVVAEPRFGRIDGQFFCTTRRNSVKEYLYFPAALPRILDGYLLGPTGPMGRTAWRRQVIATTDVPPGPECAVRQLDARWFISLC